MAPPLDISAEAESQVRLLHDALGESSGWRKDGDSRRHNRSRNAAEEEGKGRGKHLVCTNNSTTRGPVVVADSVRRAGLCHKGELFLVVIGILFERTNPPNLQSYPSLFVSQTACGT